MSIVILDFLVICLAVGASLKSLGVRACVNWRSRFLLSVLLLCEPISTVWSAEVEPLVLESKIPLGDVRGRIDHMAVDIARHRLFVAALGNDSLAVVDLDGRRLERNIGKLREPQGVGYDTPTDTIYVANRGDGAVSLFHGADLSPTGRIELGSDADNVRIDGKARHVLVGHDDGALSIVDGATHRLIGRASLDAHPESFQIDPDAGRIFVNLPNSRAIAVIDGTTGKRIATWPTGGRSANFAMALDQPHQRVLVAFRRPAELAAFSMTDGSVAGAVPTCGDIDDLFIDAKRGRVYLSCGEGSIDVLVADQASYRRVARVATAAGARTSLFVPDLDRLFIAVPARANTTASIWVFRPSP